MTEHTNRIDFLDEQSINASKLITERDETIADLHAQCKRLKKQADEKITAQRTEIDRLRAQLSARLNLVSGQSKELKTLRRGLQLAVQKLKRIVEESDNDPLIRDLRAALKPESETNDADNG